MSKLPSERLLEIVKQKIGFESLSVELEIIAQYLDEQYEQQKPCNKICTNGKDTYHEWNMRESGECFCSKV